MLQVCQTYQTVSSKPQQALEFTEKANEGFGLFGKF